MRLMIIVGIALFIAGVGVGGTLATGNNPTPPGAAVVLLVAGVGAVGSLGWLAHRLYRRP